MVFVLISLNNYIHNHLYYSTLLATVEDQNFALFNYVNELNGEIEMVLKQIEQVSNILHTLQIICDKAY